MRTILKRYIPSVVVRKIRSFQPSLMFRKASYSQCGEDLLISFVLDSILGSRPKKYLDVGANHPFKLSNTALFYSRGGQGALIEPDPYFAQLLRRKRPRDIVFECGVHFSGETQADFFIFDPPTLNTFSPIEKNRYVAMGHRLIKTVAVELKNINEIMQISGVPDFMNIDIEGLDKAVLETVDWKRYRPTCVCAETLSYETRHAPKKLNGIIELMLAQDYLLYADTFINSIFVDRLQWERCWHIR